MPTLDWIGKQAVVNHDKDVPFRLLKRDAKLSVGDSQNLLVKGDNLEALKALMPYYVGKVNCVYIDPPYNTGNESWQYNDNVNSPEIRRWFQAKAKVNTDDLTRHDKWLCMMYPRLKLLRELLHPDAGLIFVTVDDNEIARLRLMMDELFGEQNWFATLARRSMHTVRNSSKDFNLNVDFTLVYGRNKEWFGSKKERYIRIPVDKTANYPLDDGDGRGPYKLDPISARNFYTPYEHRFHNGVTWKASAGSYPRYSQETLTEMEREGRIVFTGKEPKAKRHLKDVQEGQPPNALLDPADVGFNSHGTTLLRKMIGGGTFSQPKPVEFIRHLLSMVKDKNAIILDSFAGSGTTGHAVLSMNQEDGGNRQFVLVEMEQEIAEKVTAHRLNKAVQGYSAEGEKVAGLGGGFQFMRLDATLFDAQGDINEPVTWMDLARYVFFTDTQRDLTEKKAKSPYIGSHDGTDYFLLFHERGKNTLTREALATMKGTGAPQRVVYADRCLVPETVLGKTQTTFRQIPYSVRLF